MKVGDAGLTAVILSGGASRRMGSPKALLPIAGTTFLGRLAGLLGSYCQPVVVVTGEHDREIRAAFAAQEGIRWVFNERHELGMLSSLQKGLAAVPKDAAGVAFLPVDSPALRDETLAHLGDCFRRRPPGIRIVQPRCGDRRGHPVLIAPEVAGAIFALPAGAQARDVTRAEAAACRTLYVETDDRGTVEDVDTPEEYAALAGMWAKGSV